MKPNEVMIGDWLWFTDPDTQETDPVKIEKDDIGYDGDGFWQLFNPIQITPEILETNGFIKSGYMCRCCHNLADFDNHAQLDYNLKFSTFEIKRMKNRAWTAKIYIDAHYVHELQHALRLADLNDMADNFIIEKGGQP